MEKMSLESGKVSLAYVLSLFGPDFYMCLGFFLPNLHKDPNERGDLK